MSTDIEDRFDKWEKDTKELISKMSEKGKEVSSDMKTYEQAFKSEQYDIYTSTIDTIFKWVRFRNL